MSSARDRSKTGLVADTVSFSNVDGPGNRADFGMLMMRIMAPSPDWDESPLNVIAPGQEEPVMGAYYPKGEYMTKEAFEALGDKP